MVCSALLVVITPTTGGQSARVHSIRYFIILNSNKTPPVKSLKYIKVQEARFREAEWDNYLRHGPRGQAEYHHGFEHCI